MITETISPQQNSSSKEEVLQLARKIIELDLLRDQAWESFASIVGDRAYEILRVVQNS